MSKPSQTAPAAPKQDPGEQAQQLVNEWTIQKLHNSDFSGNSQAWNHFAAARDDLVQRIANALKGD